MASFALAPMTTDMRVMTGVALALPAIFVGSAVVTPFLVAGVLYGSAAFMILLYAMVWFGFRPTAFAVTADTLRIVWPARTRGIARSEIVGVRSLTATEFRAEFGFGMRVGVGGLWGGFGLLHTSSKTFSMWVSRTDTFVIVTLKNDRPLLLTPETPAAFVQSLS